ncbi:MAG: hypothetical protein JKY21_02585 [Alcanivorax sp.]|nr:hypothetical protein [Alcanivorax sp.]
MALTIYIWLRYPKRVLYFIRRTGRVPDAVFPSTVNEKFFWRKLFDHDPRFVVLSDKLACKRWVAERVPELAMAKVRWVGENLDCMPARLKEQDVVLKANHSCGTNLFLSQEHFTESELKKIVSGWLDVNHGDEHGEWAYSRVCRKLFVEDRIRPAKGNTLSEVKIFTFADTVIRVIHIVGRFGEIRAKAWDVKDTGELVLSREKAAIAPDDASLRPPADIDYALSLAKKLGAGFDQLRVDFLYDGETWWLGELTVYNQAGYMYIASASDASSPLSKAWDLRNSWFLQSNSLPLLKRCYAQVLRRHLRRYPGF